MHSPLLDLLAPALLVPVFFAGTAFPQDFLFGATAPAGAARFGEVMALAGDVDGDGVADLLVGDPDSARAFLISGANGALLRTHTSPVGADRYGFACAGVEDLDLDGRADYAIGAPASVFTTSPGVVRVYSGVSGALLRTHTTGLPTTEFGGAIAGAGDLNGDGWPDYTVGEPFFGPNFAPPGRIHAFSGRDGSLLWSEEGHNGIAQMGFAMDIVGDVNGDRCDDVLAAEPGFGQAVLYSGKDHSILRVEPWVFGFFFWGSALASVGDVNGDGRGDYAVGTTDYVGLVQIVSGADGANLFELYGSVDFAKFGSAVLGLGDIDLDGRGDFAIATKRDAAGGTDAGRVDLFSGSTGGIIGSITGLAGDLLGSAVVLLGDVDGDGWREIGVSRPGAGVVDVYSIRRIGNPADTRYTQHGCPTSAGDLPRLRMLGEARLGSNLAVRVTGGRSASIAALCLGLEWNLDPGALAPGCIVQTYPLEVSGMALDPTGAADRAYSLPSEPSLAGIPISWQALVIDPALNSLGIAGSNGAITRLGTAPRSISLGTLGGGVRGVDSATGTGYLMYTVESVVTRFAANPLSTSAARNLVIVRWNAVTSKWQYCNDSAFYDFERELTDVLLAELDFSADTATLLAGRFGLVGDGMTAGYITSDLTVTPNRYNGGSNSGEFELGGSQFTR